MVVSSGAPESPPQVPPGIYLFKKFMMLKHQIPKLYAKKQDQNWIELKGLQITGILHKIEANLMIKL